ncbi:MAG: TolB family protein [Candidatus Promineifilaceae bacterium]
MVSCGSGTASDPSTQFVYVWYDAQDRQQLFLADVDGMTPVQLTSAEFNIGNQFDISQNRIIYTEQTADLQEHIHLLTLNKNTPSTSKIDCGDDSCTNPIWAADGRRVVYERRNREGEEPRLFWLDADSQETLPVFDDETVIGYRPQLSADGRYLSFVHIPPEGESTLALLPEGHNINDGHGHGNLLLNQQRILVFDFETGEQVALANLMNSTATWAGSSAEFLLTDMAFSGEQFGVHLMYVDPAERQMIDISGDRTVDDASPTWSPDGAWIAFNRKLASTGMGRQIWLMRPDGSEAVALTDDADWNHSQVRFSADGNRLLFQRFNVTQPTSDPSIWLFDRETSDMRQIIPAGARPQWWP